MGDFEVDTRVEGSNGRYRANISQDWEVWGPNGGYVAAIALRAAGQEAKIARPATFACHFLGRARFEAVDLEVARVQEGRRTESLHVVMRQGERPILQGMLRTALEGPGLEHDVAVMPEVAEPEMLKSWEELRPDDEAGPYPFWQNVESRVVWPERVAQQERAYEPVWREWYRYRPRATFDEVWVDAARLLLLMDTLAWPAASRPHPNAEYQAPNLDVTAWFHRFEPKSDWLLADYDSPVAEGGLMGATGRVWSRDGHLLASGGAQLLCVPVPPQT